MNSFLKGMLFEIIPKIHQEHAYDGLRRASLSDAE